MKRKISALLAADIAGYSKLVAEDEEETLRRLAAFRAVFDDFVQRYGGRIFNTAGDAVLAEFPSSVDAVRCAIDIQESFRTRNLAYPASRQMSFRIGINVGDVVERDGDLLGDGVNVAARLEGLAAPGGICISRSVYEQVNNKVSILFEDIGEQHVKNIPNAIHAYVVAPLGDGKKVIAHSYGGRLQKSRLLIAGAMASAVAAGLVVLVLAPQTRDERPKNTAPASPTAAVAVAAAPAAPAAPTAPTAPTTPTAPTAPTAPATPAARPQEAQVPAYVVPFDEAKLRALAASQKIPLPPTLKISPPASLLPAKLAEYLGAWGSDQRWGGNGRHMILIIAAIESSGLAIGHFASGPPTSSSANQVTAFSLPFVTTITDGGLIVPTTNAKHTFQLAPGDMIFGVADGLTDRGRPYHTSIVLERIR